MSKPDKDTGKSRIKILIEIRDQTGIVAEELRTAPNIPPLTAHVWGWFGDLSRGRSSGFSINAISWTDIRSYFQLIGIQASHWELQALRAVDDAYLESRLSDEDQVEIMSAQSMTSKVAKE